MKKVCLCVLIGVLAIVILILTHNAVYSASVTPAKYEAGDILAMRFLAVDPPLISYGKYPVAAYYMEYWSVADGGVKIGAKLFIPVGDPPEEGWPVKVWLHGFGGPGYDFWHWPFVNEDWRRRGYDVGMAYSNHGFICLCPWVPGAGPSQPFATYSPFSLERNAQAAFDGFKALRKLPTYSKEHPELFGVEGIHVTVDNSRQVMSTNCISSPTLIYFAAHLKEHPEVKGLKCLIADTFLPSIAYGALYIVPSSLDLPGRDAANSFALWSGPIWCLAKHEGFNLREFFTEKAIKLFEKKVETPVGKLPLMRSAQLEPLHKSHVGPELYEAVKEDVGHEPSAGEIFNWTFTENMRKLVRYETLGELLQDDFYQKYFAEYDPFFEENIEPFNPGVPLLVVGTGDKAVNNPPMPSPDERFHLIGIPRIKTLREWGWDVRVFHECGVKTTSMCEGKGHNWVMRQLKQILYP